MTAPTIDNLQQYSAIARLESLRALGDDRITKILDNLTDLNIFRNRLTERERVCRACNELQALEDAPRDAGIGDIVQSARKAFGLVHIMYGMPYEQVTSIIAALQNVYPVYVISDKLRLYNRYVGLHTAPEFKADAAQMVAELLVIGANAEDETFLTDLKRSIDKITSIILNWL